MTPIILCQRDPRWENIKIGESNLTVGAEGCLITCISMISNYFGSFMTPGEIAQHKDWFTLDGRLIWDKINIPNLKYLKEDFSRNDADIVKALKDPREVVVLEVSNPTSTKTHWMWAWSRTFWGDYKVADPWQGKEVLASTYLHSIGPITKSSYFYKP